MSKPQDDWISAITPLLAAHGDSARATSYAVAFFEGDIKLFD